MFEKLILNKNSKYFETLYSVSSKTDFLIKGKKFGMLKILLKSFLVLKLYFIEVEVLTIELFLFYGS